MLGPMVAAVIAAAPASTPEPSAADEAVVVTGERTRRNLRDTPSSAAVIGSADLRAAGATELRQALALVPNVQLGNGSKGPAIRGLDTTGPLQALPAFLGGNRPRTTIVVDGRPTSYNEFVFGAFPTWDLGRIELFRTPQTTTQGVNSIAGAIFVVSADPGFEREAAGQAIVGTYRERQVSAMASGPLGRTVAIRIAGDFRRTRTSSRIGANMRGADPNHQSFGLLRAKLLVEPDAASRLVVTIAHNRSQAPQIIGIRKPFRDRREPGATYGIFRIRSDSLAASLRRELDDQISLRLQLSAGASDAQRFAPPGLGEARNRSRDANGEAVVEWKPRPGAALLLGIAASRLRLRQSIDLSLLSGLTGSFRDRQQSFGLFGEAQLPLPAGLTMIAGLRFQSDRQRRIGALEAPKFAVPIDYDGRFTALLPKLSLSAAVAPGWTAGLLFQKAYNPGGTTIRIDSGRPEDFRAERLWDGELFVRGSLAGGKVHVEANLFRYAIRDAQRSDPIAIFTPTGQRVGFANLFNVPRARSQGAEISASGRISARLKGRLAIGLLDTKILAVDPGDPPLAGKQFDRSPRFSGVAAIDWAATPALSFSAQARSHSRYFSDNGNSPALAVGGMTMIDARASWRVGRASLFAEVRNLTDRFAMRDFSTAVAGEAEEPRRVTVGIAFGL